MGKQPGTIWTVGHSTRSMEGFLAVLMAHGIEAVADVRSLPGSRRYPHFDSQPLAESLRKAGIEYAWIPALGGRRRPRPDSRNTAWRNDAFRGYADYMETPEFRAGIDQLLTISRAKRTVILCAEAVWWRCHRSLISDHLKATGVQVLHIFDDKKTEEHPYTPAAHIRDGHLSYEASEEGDSCPKLFD
jgi:uncharacterized protein (DUF488 family)